MEIKSIVLSFIKNTTNETIESYSFDKMMELIDKEGILVEQNDNKVIYCIKNGNIYIKVPAELGLSNRFFYHIYPQNKDDLFKGREKNEFNNLDFNANDKGTTVPKDISNKSNYIIIKKELPLYPYKAIGIGQFNNDKKLWTITLRDSLPQK